MKAWDDLVAVGLVGTGRVPLPPLAGASPALDAALAGCFGLPPERKFLAAVATIATWRVAGATASATPLVGSPLAPAPDADQGACSPAAESHLARMLSEPVLTPLLPEWLVALDAAGRCLPHAPLPELLDMAASKDELRPLILPVLGARGAWLAHQNPNWVRLLPVAGREAILEHWSTAAFPDRLTLLAALRQTEPGLGRELVTSTWDQEPPREREAFLRGLVINLSMDDEPLAEAALDDRRKEVRLAAAQLAARLPASRLCRRMVERVRPLLAFQPGEKASLRNLGRGRPANISVTLPVACDKTMLRDGVEPKPVPGTPMGEAARWLTQMVSVTPPATWRDAWGARPDELVQAAGEWRAALWTGWAAAAGLHRDAEWAEALVQAGVGLLARWLSTDTDGARAQLQLGYTVVRQAWTALSSERREAFITEAFRSENRPLHDRHLAAFLLTLAPGSWTEPLGRTVLRGLQLRVRKGGAALGQDWELRRALKSYARSMPPVLAADAVAALADSAPEAGYWRSALDEFLTVLQFRHDMLAALKP